MEEIQVYGPLLMEEVQGIWTIVDGGDSGDLDLC